MWCICPLLSWDSTSNGKFNQVIRVPIQASNIYALQYWIIYYRKPAVSLTTTLEGYIQGRGERKYKA